MVYAEGLPPELGAEAQVGLGLTLACEHRNCSGTTSARDRGDKATPRLAPAQRPASGVRPDMDRGVHGLVCVRPDDLHRRPRESRDYYRDAKWNLQFPEHLK